MIRRTVAFTVAALIAIILVVIGVGYALPQDHVAAATATFAAPVDRVFSAIVDVDAYPTWRDDVTRVEVLGRDPLRWREHSDGDAITFEVVERTAPTTLRVRVADPDLPFGGTWTYDLRPEGSGTRLTITENGEVYNPIFRFMSRFVFGHRATIDAFLAGLQTRVDRE